MHAIAMAALAVGLFAQLGPGPSDQPVKIADPTVTSATGKVDRMIIKRYLRRDQNKYRYCYELALTKDPTLRGTLTIKFRVLLDGTVTGVRVEGIANDVENCVANFVRRIQFPKVPEEAEVRTKVMLKPSKPVRRRGGHGCGGLHCGRLG